MSEMQIRLKKGSRVKNSAETIFAEVEASKVDGDVSLQTLVDRAKPVSAPLHNEFTWKNAEAANQWRLHEARKIVQSVEVVHLDTGTETRAWESVMVVEASAEDNEPPVTRRVFRSVDEILADPETRSDLLVRAIGEYQSLRKRYAGLQELAQVHAALDTVVLNTEAA